MAGQKYTEVGGAALRTVVQALAPPTLAAEPTSVAAGAEQSLDEPGLGRVLTAVTAAPVAGGDAPTHLVDVLATPGPRRLAALLAPDRHAHGRSLPFVVVAPDTLRRRSQ